ncbi:MAG: hypothetical protein K0S78_2416 [Thermomicrobiales bacterium]|jgi:hypothetical protein|nr:hypothetical protein [Thermomicrobiales bacterium]
MDDRRDDGGRWRIAIEAAPGAQPHQERSLAIT